MAFTIITARITFDNKLIYEKEDVVDSITNPLFDKIIRELQNKNKR